MSILILIPNRPLRTLTARERLGAAGCAPYLSGPFFHEDFENPGARARLANAEAPELKVHFACCSGKLMRAEKSCLARAHALAVGATAAARVRLRLDMHLDVVCTKERSQKCSAADPWCPEVEYRNTLFEYWSGPGRSLLRARVCALVATDRAFREWLCVYALCVLELVQTTSYGVTGRSPEFRSVSATLVQLASSKRTHHTPQMALLRPSASSAVAGGV